MPAKSRSQFRFMQAVAHGSIKAPGLSRAEAAEYVAGQSPKGLPERVGKPRPLGSKPKPMPRGRHEHRGQDGRYAKKRPKNPIPHPGRKG
jgi:hypothetical protein